MDNFVGPMGVQALVGVRGAVGPMGDVGVRGPVAYDLTGKLGGCIFYPSTNCPNLRRLNTNRELGYQGESDFAMVLSLGHYQCCETSLNTWKVEIFNENRDMVVTFLRANPPNLVECLNFLHRHGYDFNQEIGKIVELHVEKPLSNNIVGWFQERGYPVVASRFLLTKSSRSL